MNNEEKLKSGTTVANPDMNNEEKLKSENMLFGLGVVFLLISPLVCIASYIVFKLDGDSPNFLWYICYFIVWIIILILMARSADDGTKDNNKYADDAIQESEVEIYA